MTNNDNIRRFSYSNPVRYEGYDYPTTQANLLDRNGNTSSTNVFADANGQYFVLGDNEVAQPVMPVNTLDDVTVTPSESVWQQMDHNFASFKRHSEIMRKQAMMRAAGYDVPQNGLWNLQQQMLWDRVTTKPKEYDTTLMGLAGAIADTWTNGNIEHSNPLNQGSISTYNPDNVDWNKTRKSQSKFINALSDTYGPIVAAAFAPAITNAFVSAPIASIATGLGGMAGGYAVNKASEAMTGRDFGTNVSMYTPLTPGMGEALNPGYVAGGYGAERRMLDALYNQVTPVSYGTPANSAFASKGKVAEIGLAMKDFFTPKIIRTSVDEIPAWRKRIDLANTTPITKAETVFRDDAWRLAMKQKARTLDINGNPHSLYVKNPDGTYSYDLDYVDKVRANTGMPLLKREAPLPLVPNDGVYKEGVNKGWSRDFFTTNGGNIGVDFTLPKGWDTDPNRIHPDQIILKEPFRIHDKWDLQFLKDERASFNPAFSRWLTRHPNKITNYVRNMDALEAVGGNPFMLDMQVPPNTILTRKVNTK